MNKTEEISNVLLTHSFIAIAFIIVIFGIVIISIGGMSNSPLLIILGIICLVLMPYSFRVVKSLRMLKIADPESKKPKLILHEPIFVNDINYPDDIELSQVVTITQDHIFSNLIEFTFIENGEKQKINSFIKKKKLKYIQSLSIQQTA